MLSETAVFQYKCENFYHPEADGGISILDESLGFELPIGSRGMGDKISQQEIIKFSANNERPRKNMNFSTPKECFYKNIT